MPRVSAASDTLCSPAALARVELLIRTWLRADEASERAWDEACRAKKEVVDALKMIGDEHSMDGWNYSVVRGECARDDSLIRHPVRTGKWKRGAP